jgi:hypothetical protein
MLIVENAGQWPAAARFQVWNSPLGPGVTWLAEDAIWLVVASGKLHVAGSEGFAGSRADLPPANLPPATFHALKLTFPGSNPDVRIEPFEPLTTTISYFLGSDPEQWRPDVPVWCGVRYVDLYPGVDLVLGGSDGAWRIEAVPGATTRQVRVHVEGVPLVAVNGAVAALEGGGELLSVALPVTPFVYQVTGLDSEGDALALTVAADAQPARAPGPVDNPGDLIYSTFLGRNPFDYANAIAVDGASRAYVAGYTESSSFPTTPGAFDPSFGGGSEGFVTKMNIDGSGLDYATFLGGSSSDGAWGIAVDGTGRATVTGYTYSSDFPATPGAFDTSHNGNHDAFVVRLNASGTDLDYGTFLGGSGRDGGHAIAVDGTSRTYVMIYTESSDFAATPGAFDRTFGGGTCGTSPNTRPCPDAFVARLNAAGSDLDYGTFLGDSGGDDSRGIAVDGTGRATVTGYTTSSDFPTTPGAFDRTFGGGTCGTPPNTVPCPDAFVARLNAAGSDLDFSTFLGGSSGDGGMAIAVDGTGRAHVTGLIQSNDFTITPGGFVARLNAAGSALDFGMSLGGVIGYGIAVDGTGRAYVTGSASGGFPTTPGAFDTSYNGNGDAFVARLNAAGSALDYATFLGGSESDYGNGIAVDGTGRAYVAGYTRSSNFPTTPGAFDRTFNGSIDAFVSKLNLDPYSPDVVAPIEQPPAGAFVSGAVTLRGYAIDRASAAGAGIDMVHIYLDGPYGTGTIIGGATYGLDRLDVAAQYGERFRASGWELDWDTTGLAPGVHRLYLYAHRTTDNGWSLMDPHLVVAPGGPARWLPIMLRQR